MIAQKINNVAFFSLEMSAEPANQTVYWPSKLIYPQIRSRRKTVKEDFASLKK